MHVRGIRPDRGGRRRDLTTAGAQGGWATKEVGRALKPPPGANSRGAVRAQNLDSKNGLGGGTGPNQ